MTSAALEIPAQLLDVNYVVRMPLADAKVVKLTQDSQFIYVFFQETADELYSPYLTSRVSIIETF